MKRIGKLVRQCNVSNGAGEMMQHICISLFSILGAKMSICVEITKIKLE